MNNIIPATIAMRIITTATGTLRNIGSNLNLFVLVVISGDTIYYSPLGVSIDSTMDVQYLM